MIADKDPYPLEYFPLCKISVNPYFFTKQMNLSVHIEYKNVTAKDFMPHLFFKSPLNNIDVNYEINFDQTKFEITIPELWPEGDYEISLIIKDIILDSTMFEIVDKESLSLADAVEKAEYFWAISCQLLRNKRYDESILFTMRAASKYLLSKNYNLAVSCWKETIKELIKLRYTKFSIEYHKYLKSILTVANPVDKAILLEMINTALRFEIFESDNYNQNIEHSKESEDDIMVKRRVKTGGFIIRRPSSGNIQADNYVANLYELVFG